MGLLSGKPCARGRGACGTGRASRQSADVDDVLLDDVDELSVDVVDEVDAAVDELEPLPESVL